MTNSMKKVYLYNYFRKYLNLNYDEKVLFNEKYPLKLYKYRECNEKNFALLLEKKVWFSNPRVWNDPLDYSILFDSTLHQIKFLEKLAEYKEYYDSLSEVGREKAIPLNIICISLLGIYNQIRGNNYEKLFKDEMNVSVKAIKKNMDKAKIEEFFKLDKEIKATGDRVISLFINANQKLKKNVAILCLSETNNNPHQWAIYGDEGRGFCIGYSLVPKTKKDEELLGTLLPIYYGRKDKINIMDCLIDSSLEFVNPKMNEEVLQKVFVSLYTKDIKWQGESEWRLRIEEPIQEGVCVDFDFVFEVILGDKISKQNENRLIEISKRLSIPVYKRKLDVFHSKFIIIPYK